jgi:flagellar hook-associated protein 2
MVGNITFGGLATGMATDDIVKKLMASERAPIDRLNKTKTDEAIRLQAYAQLNTRLDDLRKAADAMNITSEVRTTKANLSSEAEFTATTSNASAGSYNITVMQLAQVQKNVSDGYLADATFKTGTITVNGKDITIDTTNNTLQGLKAAINAQSGTTGVTASIIPSSNGKSYLVFKGKDAATSFTVDATGLTGGAGVDLNTATTQDAQKAIVSIDGLEVSSNSNTLTDVISGVTLNLKAKSPISDSVPTTYTPTMVDIISDPGSLKEKISTFVSSYNKVMEWINQGYTTKTDAEIAAAKAAGQEDILSDYLRGDSTVRSVKQGLQSILTNSINGSGSLHMLNDVGITTNRDGTLATNSSKLDTALASNLDGLVTLLAGDDTTDGVMKKFNSYLVSTTSATQGMYANKKKLYTKMAAGVDAQVTRKETLMVQIEKTMRARFTAMENLVSGFNAQSSFLTQQMNLFTKSTSDN